MTKAEQPTIEALERIARAISPTTWKNKEAGASGYSFEQDINHSLEVAARILTVSGDLLCHKCGEANPVWYAPDDLWNATMGDEGGVLCPSCFCVEVGNTHAPSLAAQDGLVEAICQARCFVPNVRWDDGMTEGAAQIERMIAEKIIEVFQSWPLSAIKGDKS